MHLFKSFSDFFKNLYQHRYAIWTLSKRDFEQKYVQNYFGVIWAIADPLAFVGILYLVFDARFGKIGLGEIPFVVYLLVGQVAFDMFGAIHGLTTVLRDYEFLLKKVNFHINMLPVMRMISALLLHAIVLVIALVILLWKDIGPTWYWLQIFYYMFALCALLIGLSWTTSSIYLFFPDIKNVVNIIVRMLFFITPIFWHLDHLPAETASLLRLNPLVYIVNGYRDSLLNSRGFWVYPGQTIYFWSICIVVWFIGVLIFRKLRPQFAEIV